VNIRAVGIQIGVFLETLGYFIKDQQSKFFESCHTCQSNKVICIQLDFSENFSVLNQDEVPNAHWVSTQYIIFTAVAWFKGEPAVYAIISDSLHHDKYAVNIFLQKLLPPLQNGPLLTVINVFYNGAAQHFKQRFTMASITVMSYEPSIIINWHFLQLHMVRGLVMV
jgi:hypothetical protein